MIKKGKKLGVEAKGLTESSKDRLAEDLATVISVHNARAMITKGELAQFKDVHEEVYKDAEVIEGEGGDDFASGRARNANSFRGYVEDLIGKKGPLPDGGGLGSVVPQAPFPVD